MKNIFAVALTLSAFFAMAENQGVEINQDIEHIQVTGYALDNNAGVEIKNQILEIQKKLAEEARNDVLRSVKEQSKLIAQQALSAGAMVEI